MKSIPIQRRILPSHAVLRSFECAARHESFTLAAEELNLTQSAVSRQVRELEQTLETELFRRVGRRIVLTEAGQVFARELAVDLENIHQTIVKAMSTGQRGSALRVAVLPSFASRWLIPRLSQFMDLHPDIEVSFATKLNPFDIERERFDLAIHFGQDNWPNVKMEVLCSETLIAVCSPKFKERYAINETSDLCDAPLLHMESRPSAWSVFFNETNTVGKNAHVGKYFDQFSMVISAATASLGAALIPTYLIEKELSTGALSKLDETTVTTKNNYYLVTRHGEKSKQLTLFCDWLKRSVGD